MEWITGKKADSFLSVNINGEGKTAQLFQVLLLLLLMMELKLKTENDSVSNEHFKNQYLKTVNHPRLLSFNFASEYKIKIKINYTLSSPTYQNMEGEK
jgi:hypothetical protein